MKKIVTLLLLLMTTVSGTWLSVAGQEVDAESLEESVTADESYDESEDPHSHDEDQNRGFSADDHHGHNHGPLKANYIPSEILNPDGSRYEAPEQVKEYVGLYTGAIQIDEMKVKIHFVLEIFEDGLFNLAHYYENNEEDKGLRFFVNADEKLEARGAVYQDLSILTGALREADGGIGAGVVGQQIQPVVLLDEKGEPAEMVTYMDLAFGLRDNYSKPRVYSNVGLAIIDEELMLDVNQLIGLNSEKDHVVQLEKVETSPDQALVEQRTYELLQDNFDHNLNSKGDFDLNFETANEFVQAVLMMQLKTNASFPQETDVQLIEAEKVQGTDSKGNEIKAEYVMSLNDEVLFASVGDRLYMANEFDGSGDSYQNVKWKSN
ncbi:hypothetical protein HZY91_08605 [Facklamia sp. DSM 111018]|uniref:DUF5067 domain-containing protein n=1 Tax=Facklamia lactis TaxID=2749967 RepID=A0ABS0LS02_9LACT|nr:hypothetical protein [Facklamia lactis]MBG9981146.1 hypothetical protein [Facklamia lactis]MBG9986947.1 hypothetical protein [Facklamia lactis]